MAKVIRATPTLVGAEAISFLARMKRNDSARPNKADRRLLEAVREHQKFFSSPIQ
ncbi:MAG: hypothetical protein V1676_07040 [Candidatus Diapherotrites archaeon]